MFNIQYLIAICIIPHSRSTGQGSDSSPFTLRTVAARGPRVFDSGLGMPHVVLISSQQRRQIGRQMHIKWSRICLPLIRWCGTYQRPNYLHVSCGASRYELCATVVPPYQAPKIQRLLNHTRIKHLILILYLNSLLLPFQSSPYQGQLLYQKVRWPYVTSSCSLTQGYP